MIENLWPQKKTEGISMRRACNKLLIYRKKWTFRRCNKFEITHHCTAVQLEWTRFTLNASIFPLQVISAVRCDVSFFILSLWWAFELLMQWVFPRMVRNIPTQMFVLFSLLVIETNIPKKKKELSCLTYPYRVICMAEWDRLYHTSVQITCIEIMMQAHSIEHQRWLRMVQGPLRLQSG